ncbi:MAG: hypothetical protein LBR18_00850, partial [Tannerella sp.]|nr:hypothetical protein [Tannerella sp.]
LWNGQKAIIICGNPTAQAVNGALDISLEGTPLSGAKTLLVTDLWNGGKPRSIKASDLSKLPVGMKADKTLRGGLAVFKIETKTL